MFSAPAQKNGWSSLLLLFAGTKRKEMQRAQYQEKKSSLED